MKKKTRMNLIDHVVNMVDSYHAESDRAAAILAASFLEASLALFLKEFMIDDQQACDELLKGFGPLATLSARRKCAYAFGYIDEKTRNDIKYIAKIRNEFGHNYKMNSFRETPIPDLCKNLSTATVSKELRVQYLTAISSVGRFLQARIAVSERLKPNLPPFAD